MKTDTRLPYTEISDDFLPPRDPVLGYIKVGSKATAVRYTRAGKPWVAPTRLLDPARFEIVTREKRTEKVKGKGNASGQDFTVDLGYVRDADFHELEGVGPKPSSLRVRLLYPRWNQNLIAFLGAYGGGAWVCRGNGVEATDIKRGACVCPCPRLVQFSGKYEGTKPADKLVCKPHAVLNVILEDAGVFGGFWAFKTTSFESISNLTKALRIFEEMFGRLDGLPLELRVMAVTKPIPGGGTTVQPIVTLVLPAAMESARQLAREAADESRKYLPAGGELDETKYLEAVVGEMEQEAKSYAGEYLPVEVVEGEKDDVREMRQIAGRAVESDRVRKEHELVPEEEGGVVEGELRKQAGVQEMQRTAEATVAAAEAEMRKAEDELAAELKRRAAENADDPQPEDEVEDPTREEDPDPEDVGDFIEERLTQGLRENAEATDSDRNDDEAVPVGSTQRERDERGRAAPTEEYDRADYELATKVLEASGWEPHDIAGRLEYHVKTGTLDKLLERLERGHPEAWAKVAEEQPAEPTDGLAS